jgi:hypothetical protein
MKSTIKLCLLPVVFLLPISLLAQKDSIHLTCPLEHGSGREPKEAYSWDPPDQKVVFISHADSIIRSCVNGEVVKIAPNENDEYEVVIFSKDLYFWYNNVSKPIVSVRQVVKAGQTIGIYKFGDELEFRMYKEMKKDEPQMIDPRNLLECKVPKAE